MHSIKTNIVKNTFFQFWNSGSSKIRRSQISGKTFWRKFFFPFFLLEQFQYDKSKFSCSIDATTIIWFIKHCITRLFVGNWFHYGRYETGSWKHFMEITTQMDEQTALFKAELSAKDERWKNSAIALVERCSLCKKKWTLFVRNFNRWTIWKMLRWHFWKS